MTGVYARVYVSAFMSRTSRILNAGEPMVVYPLRMPKDTLAYYQRRAPKTRGSIQALMRRALEEFRKKGRR